MDPLSLSVSIITVLTLAGQLVTLGNAYASSVSGCPKEINDLLTELSALSQILVALKDIVNPATATSATPIIWAGILASPVDECANQLKEMLAFLTKFQNPKNKMKKIVQRLMWPLKEAETREWINKIEGHKSTFTLALSTDGMAVTRAISIDVVKLKQGQEMARKQQQLEYISKRLRNIREWLSPGDPRINYKAAHALQQAGTGKWFTEGSQFREWFQNDNSFFWIHGIPGTGKTILSSIIIDKIIAEAQGITLVYFYCNFKDPAKQSAVNIYGSLIAQLIEKAVEIPDELDALYAKYNKRPPVLDHLKDVFSGLIQSIPKVFIIIDGLDECTDHEAVVDSLLELKNHPNGNTNVLFTSRNEPATLLGIHSLEIKAENVVADIELYVRGEIERRVKLRRLKPGIKAEITAELVHGANGMFRWVKYCLEQIASLRNDKAIRQALHSMPPNLEESYEATLTRIPEEDRHLAIRVFQWLVCSIRPMTIEEVAEAITIEFGDTTGILDHKLNNLEDILDICSGLVGLTNDTRILVFTHFTVKEYLMSERIAEGPVSSYQINPTAIHNELAKFCLTYISYEDFDFGPCETNNELKCRFERYPLLEYAAHNWQRHARNDDKSEDDELASMIEEFLNPLSWSKTDKGTLPTYLYFILFFNPETESPTEPSKVMPPDQPTVTVADNPGPPPKRQKKDDPVYPRGLASLDQEISPPTLRSSNSDSASTTIARSNAPTKILPRDKHSTRKKSRLANSCDFIDLTEEEPDRFDTTPSRVKPKPKEKQPESRPTLPSEDSSRALPSPFQLTTIRDLPASENVDTIGIKDILGDVMIKEAWIFNYIIDLDWVMSQFDPDIRRIVNVKIIHGSWREEDSNRIRLEEQGKNYPNVKIICAYMPEAFGTHHSKIIVLFRHDDSSQVIIHTSNMIAFDWTNMTQAAWCSPLLPLISARGGSSPSVTATGTSVGDAFKNAILLYFAKYDRSRTGDLVEGLRKYSFHDIRAVFIGSVPGKFQVDGRGKGDTWGWMALKRIMGNIPLHNDSQDEKERDSGAIVVQVSSIATLGQENVWFSPVFLKALSTSRNVQDSSTSKSKRPEISIIFPTAEEVRDSLNGYNSGAAIHTKIQSKPQQKQLSYLQPFLCHWDSSLTSDQRSPSSTVGSLSGRSRAAPHIKTYIRFADKACAKIDWAMLTSANLSTQAWGSSFGNSTGRLMERGEGEVRICSYEAGVVVYPELFKDCKEEEVEMVPVFKKDKPIMDGTGRKRVVGLRMPYDLPTKRYGENDLPWCGTMSYGEVDWKGQSWGGD